MIQGTSRGTESRRGKASRSRGSRRVEDRKNIKQKKVREVVKYLVQQKELIVEHDSWKKEENLENAKEVVAEFEGRVNTEVRQQEKLDMAEEKNFGRENVIINILRMQHGVGQRVMTIQQAVPQQSQSVPYVVGAPTLLSPHVQ